MATNSTNATGLFCGAFNASLPLCELKIARGDDSDASCCEGWVSPSEGTSGGLTYALNVLSVLCAIYMIPPYHYARINTNLRNAFLMVAVNCSFSLLMGPITSLKRRGTFYEDERGIVLENIGGAMCTVEAFMTYLAPAFLAPICLCVAFNLYTSFTVAGAKLPNIQKQRAKVQLVFCAISALVVALASVAPSTSGVYAVYCSVVHPLAYRLLFYIPLSIMCLITIGFMLPVFAAMYKQSRKSKQVSPSAKGKKKKDPFKAAILRQSPDAGKVGITELISSSIMVLFTLIFGFAPRVQRWWRKKLGIARRGDSTASSVTAGSSGGQ